MQPGPRFSFRHEIDEGFPLPHFLIVLGPDDDIQTESNFIQKVEVPPQIPGAHPYRYTLNRNIARWLDKHVGKGRWEHHPYAGSFSFATEGAAALFVLKWMGVGVAR